MPAANETKEAGGRFISLTGKEAEGSHLCFLRKYETLKNEVSAFMDSHIPVFEAEGQKTLGEAMRYSVLSGGKRIRGVLALTVCELLTDAAGIVGASSGLARDNILHLAGAIEFIHAYSLIHDDMPSMDNDDYRRGKPTCHKVFGEGMAMLAGDALLNLAFEILTAKASEINDKMPGNHGAGLNFSGAAALVARAAGSMGMAGGQAIDLCADITDEAHLDNLHRLKTGAMFDAAILAPAICLCAGENDYGALRGYSGALGLAFQISDDISDMEGAGAIDERLNYAALFGISRAKARLAEACSEAAGYLKHFSQHADFLREIIAFVSGAYN